jgi:hypothetical protein
MKNRKRMRDVVILLSVALIASGAAQGGIVAYRSIIDLVTTADLIVVGEVAAVEPGPTDDSGFVQILPTEYLKGSVSGGSLRLAYQRIGPMFRKSLKGRRVLAFASKDPDTGWRLVPMVDGTKTFLDQNLLAADKPVSQPLVARGDHDTPIQKVIKELVTIHTYSDSSDALSYLMPLAWQGVEADTMSVVFRAMIDSSAKNGLVPGTTGLAALGRLEGLESLDEALASGHNEVTAAAHILESHFKSTDARGVAILTRWLDRNSPAAIRAAAAGALARVHTPAAILVLGPALQDADFQVRWRAIGGLAMFANNVPIGGAGPAAGDWRFRSDDTIRFSINEEAGVAKNEDYYLNFWRGWWRENADAIAEFANANQ